MNARILIFAPAFLVILILALMTAPAQAQRFLTEEEMQNESPAMADTIGGLAIVRMQEAPLAKVAATVGDTVGGWVITEMVNASIEAFEFNLVNYKGSTSLRIKYTVMQKGGYVKIAKVFTDQQYSLPQTLGWMGMLRQTADPAGPFFEAFLSSNDTMEVFQLTGINTNFPLNAWNGYLMGPKNSNPSIRNFDKIEIKLSLLDYNYDRLEVGVVEFLIDHLVNGAPAGTHAVIDGFEAPQSAPKSAVLLPLEPFDFRNVLVGSKDSMYMQIIASGTDTLKISDVKTTVPWLTVTPYVTYVPPGKVIWALLPGYYMNWKVIYTPQDTMTPGPWPIIFTTNAESSPDSGFVTADIPTGISDIVDQTPDSYGLSQNYPNPFNPTTTIAFKLPSASFVQLIIFDLAGRKVRTLINGENLGFGNHYAVFDGRDDFGGRVASGMYIYRMEAGRFTEAKKMLLLK